LLSDFNFYAIAMPQLGPGKGVGIEGREDFGRELVTGNPSDRYKFRTPTLRNVALTAPYGHSGAFNTLEGVVRHHLDPVYSLYNYDWANFVAPYREDLAEIDFWVMDKSDLVEAIADANELKKNNRLRARDVGDIVAFLKSLADSGTIDLRHDVPSFVPSGLPIYE
jgi:cytochrome c peroxidase